jgi:hypothetical protein
MMQRLSGARIVLAVFLSVSTIAPATAASVDGIELYSTS